MSLASSLGHIPLRKSYTRTSQGGLYGTALQVASSGGHEKIVELRFTSFVCGAATDDSVVGAYFRPTGEGPEMDPSSGLVGQASGGGWRWVSEGEDGESFMSSKWLGAPIYS